MRRRFDELDVFRKIYGHSERKLCTAGIVRVDLDESRMLGTDETPGENAGESVNRRSVLIVMKTLGTASNVARNLLFMPSSALYCSLAFSMKRSSPSIIAYAGTGDCVQRKRLVHRGAEGCRASIEARYVQYSAVDLS